MKNKIALITIALLSLSGAAMAQHHKMDGHHDKISKELKLTDEQTAQMKALHESYRAEQKTAREAQRAEMNKFYNNSTFNADEALKISQKNHNDRTVRKMKFRHSMTQILTPEQRALHTEMMNNKRKGGHGKGHGKDHGKKHHD